MGVDTKSKFKVKEDYYIFEHIAFKKGDIIDIEECIVVSLDDKSSTTISIDIIRSNKAYFEEIFDTKISISEIDEFPKEEIKVWKLEFNVRCERSKLYEIEKLIKSSIDAILN